MWTHSSKQYYFPNIVLSGEVPNTSVLLRFTDSEYPFGIFLYRGGQFFLVEKTWVSSTCRKSLTNFITKRSIEYTSPRGEFKLITLEVIDTDWIDDTQVFSTKKNWPPRYKWNITESDVKHHNPSPSLYLSVWTNYESTSLLVNIEFIVDMKILIKCCVVLDTNKYRSVTGAEQNVATIVICNDPI
jgi:hypothetical protein